jgi:hypothetical protein
VGDPGAVDRTLMIAMQSRSNDQRKEGTQLAGDRKRELPGRKFRRAALKQTKGISLLNGQCRIYEAQMDVWDPSLLVRWHPSIAEDLTALNSLTILDPDIHQVCIFQDEHRSGSALSEVCNTDDFTIIKWGLDILVFIDKRYNPDTNCDDLGSKACGKIDTEVTTPPVRAIQDRTIFIQNKRTARRDRRRPRFIPWHRPSLTTTAANEDQRR